MNKLTVFLAAFALVASASISEAQRGRGGSRGGSGGGSLSVRRSDGGMGRVSTAPSRTASARATKPIVYEGSGSRRSAPQTGQVFRGTPGQRGWQTASAGYGRYDRNGYGRYDRNVYNRNVYNKNVDVDVYGRRNFYGAGYYGYPRYASNYYNSYYPGYYGSTYSNPYYYTSAYNYPYGYSGYYDSSSYSGYYDPSYYSSYSGATYGSSFPTAYYSPGSYTPTATYSVSGLTGVGSYPVVTTPEPLQTNITDWSAVATGGTGTGTVSTYTPTATYQTQASTMIQPVVTEARPVAACPTVTNGKRTTTQRQTRQTTTRESRQSRQQRDMAEERTIEK